MGKVSPSRRRSSRSPLRNLPRSAGGSTTSTPKSGTASWRRTPAPGSSTRSPPKLSRLTSPASPLRFEALRDSSVLGVLSRALSCRSALRRREVCSSDPHHPSLHLKKIGCFWSCRVGLHYRVLGVDGPDGSVVWFWIATHTDYDKLVG